jgi:hypothetical protein
MLENKTDETYLIGVFDNINKAREAIDTCTNLLLDEYSERLKTFIDQQDQRNIKLINDTISDIISRTFAIKKPHEIIGDFLISEVRMNVLDQQSCSLPEAL